MSVAKFLKPPSRLVTKADGSVHPFDIAKMQRWESDATSLNVDWKTVVSAVEAQLPSKVTSQQIHDTLVAYCLAKDELQHSRMAAVLVTARIRKYMSRHLGVSPESNFSDIAAALFKAGLWSSTVAKRVEGNAQTVNDWYKGLLGYPFESWQVIQWCDKYSCKKNGNPVETPVIGILGIAIAIHGVTQDALDFAHAVAGGKINLPTPTVNGCRNGDFDTISCSVISGGDTVPSLGVATHLAYTMTAKKAGIGIEMVTRAAGADVKGGRIKHLGKHPIYANIDTAVKMFTQLGRGGSATVTFSVYDPDVLDLLALKSQRTPLDMRLDKLDYSLSYDDAFMQAVIANEDYQTVCVSGMLGPKLSARTVLKRFLQIRQETGRVYCFNKDAANHHTPFHDEITLSNLCQEIALPTKPFTDMADLHKDQTDGEIAFCALAAINVMRVSEDEYEHIAYLAVLTVDRLITKAPAMTAGVRAKMQSRRSLGIGFTGLAGWLAQRSLSYGETDAVEELAERHYYWLLKASQRLVSEHGLAPCVGIDEQWLPIDTKGTSKAPTLDWEALRGKPRRNSVLVAHMPTESSAVFSNAPNGLYPVRNSVIQKASRHGLIAYLAPAYIKERAWRVTFEALAKTYGAVQAFADQAISADYYVVPSDYPSGKVPMSVLMKQFVYQWRQRLKTMYYSNTEDSNGGAFSTQSKPACESGCTL